MGSSDPRHAFVGDVQGCADEFDALLGRLESTLGADFHLHCVGDMINRGPDNLRVLERLRGRIEAGQADYVLGNHEVGLMARYLGIRESSPGDTVSDVLDSSEVGEWVEWLRGQSICRAGQIAGQRYVMVHASVHPSWDFETCRLRADRAEQQLRAGSLEDCRRFLVDASEPDDARDDLGRFLSCRSVDQEGGWSSREPDSGSSEPWHAVWRREGHDYGVVYGHWASQGLVVEPGLRGLDTGCVHHGPDRPGSLTAWTPSVDSESGLFEVPDDHFISEPAHQEHGRRRAEAHWR
ncbi:MAG: metallophosphoesterase [Myxococcota bacterium]|nr:hypothetical protein [Spirochaeta sp.]RPG13885.1 MAG: hypothetical protein CBC32_001345 [Proteobacteria bacterium TMED72]